jgi:hypothetical protein
MKKVAVDCAMMLIALVFFAGSFIMARADGVGSSSFVQAAAPAPQKPRIPQKVNSFADKNAMIKFLQQVPAYPDKFVAQMGLAAGDADLSTHEAWATAINDGRGLADRVTAGFYTVTVENTSGVTWKAAIKATFDVSIVQGQVEIAIPVYRDITNFAGRNMKITAAGTYELTTSSFDLEPGQKYHAIVEIFCNPAKDQAASAKAKIRDVKWNIEF